MKTEILRTLLYFDVFQYPLRVEEIHACIGVKGDSAVLQDCLEQLIEEGRIFKLQSFYSVRNDAAIVPKRVFNNSLADQIMPRAKNIAKRISSFPFVASVLLSGTISKNVMHQDSDIDFFIITKEKRLWIAKLFLVIYKRLILFNNKEEFCINYFISFSNLKIPEENIFTAYELKSLIPVVGFDGYRKLIAQNSWVSDHCPNWKMEDKAEKELVSKNIISKAVQYFLNGKIGDRFETMLMNYAQKRNIKKYKEGLSDEQFELMFRSTADQAKVHNSNHQKRILDKYLEHIAIFERQNNIVIDLG